jgi:hypothetical protein
VAEPAPFESPWAFLGALAKRLHTTPDRVPAQRATEELILWLESVASAGMPLPVPFPRVAARLVYEHARLALPPGQDDVFALAERLKAENHGRPQAATWQPSDWLKLARLVLEKRRLPIAAFFREEPPTPEEVVRNVEVPFAARYVEQALDPDARQLSSPPLFALLELAEQLLLAAAGDIEEVQAMLDDLRTAAGVPRRPPGRSDSAKVAAILQSDNKLAEILAEAHTPKPIPFFRRQDIEALFGLKKRQAVNLMHRIGAVRVSRELALEQRELVRWLERMILNPAVGNEPEDRKGL